MLVSLDWLKRYVDTDASPEDVAERIIMSGFDIDGIEAVGSDHQLDVEVTWNRPDCQSHLGIAREVAGLLGLPMTIPPVDLPALSADRIDVAVDDPDLCPLYTARIIRGVTVGPSPAWLVGLLETVGVRSINNVVDVTNFVLMETGHPLHAFDLSLVRGPRLAARRATGEKMTTLDDTELTFTADDVAIADAGGPVALGGVMGGANSEVRESTTDIALEVALFAPLAIRATSKRHGVRTESSFRFERFVNPARAQYASDRAAALFVELCGATSVGPICSAGPGEKAPSRSVELRTAQVERVFGVAVATDEIRRILASLGCEEMPASDAGSTGWRTPSWRPDLVQEIDLVEEVARRVGFDRIPTAVSIPVRPVQRDPLAEALAHIRAEYISCGLRECVTEPFVGPGAYDIGLFDPVPALVVENPLRTEESLLRRSIVGTLLRVARGNADRGNRGLRLFEIAPVYLRGDGSETRELMLGGAVLAGDFFDAKGCVEALLASLGLTARARWTRGAPAPLGDDRAATVHVDDEVVGCVGQLDRRALEAYGLDEATSVFELDAGRLAALGSTETACRPLSRYPEVERDLDLVVDESVPWAALAACVADGAGDLLESVAPFDIFRGKGVDPGTKSVTLRFTLRALDRTLTAAEADACVARILGRIQESTGGRLRA